MSRGLSVTAEILVWYYNHGVSCNCADFLSVQLPVTLKCYVIVAKDFSVSAFLLLSFTRNIKPYMYLSMLISLLSNFSLCLAPSWPGLAAVYQTTDNLAFEF